MQKRRVRAGLLIALLAVLLGIASFFMAACTVNVGGNEHNYAEAWTSDASGHWHACEDEGCTEKGSFAAHTFGTPTVTKAATCTEAGSQTLVCTVCKYEKTEAIAATGHDLVWVTDDPDEHWQVCQTEGCTYETEPVAHNDADNGWSPVEGSDTHAHVFDYCGAQFGEE